MPSPYVKRRRAVLLALAFLFAAIWLARKFHVAETLPLQSLMGVRYAQSTDEILQPDSHVLHFSWTYDPPVPIRVDTGQGPVPGVWYPPKKPDGKGRIELYPPGQDPIRWHTPPGWKPKPPDKGEDQNKPEEKDRKGNKPGVQTTIREPGLGGLHGPGPQPPEPGPDVLPRPPLPPEPGPDVIRRTSHVPPPYVPPPMPPLYITATPGGVDLNPKVHVLGTLGNLRGAVIDPKTHSLVIVGSQQLKLPAASPDDWYTALSAVQEGQMPKFSLDPADPQHPDGPYLKCVYYGPIANTAVGKSMYEADLLLKKMGLGLAVPKVPGFRSLLDIALTGHAASASATYMRFWIVCDSVGIKRSDRALVFSRPRMRVCTERMYASSSGLVSSGGVEDPAGAAFARWATEHYDELAAYYKPLARVQQLASIIALAKWVVANGIEPNLASLLPQNQPVTTPTTEKALNATKTRTYTRERQTRGAKIIQKITKTVYVFGGVDLSVSLPANTKDPAAERLAKSVQSVIAPQLSRTQVFSLPTEPNTVAIVVPAA